LRTKSAAVDKVTFRDTPDDGRTALFSRRRTARNDACWNSGLVTRSAEPNGGVNGRHAVVAGLDTGGRISTCTIERNLEPESSYLSLVIRAIGDRERVVILGPSSIRLALEREYVAIYQRPDRLVDVEPSGPVDEAELVDRLNRLAA
jgi:hypothetical protein